ncbi:MAG TPA: nuclease, partial [Spirochaeta sp.]|nr:nuclease [Spirochaeta sp.]
MYRVVSQKLTEWKDSTRRKPLILRGARQVGKTWLVENFLADEFDNYAKIDFEQRRDLHTVFDGDLEPKKLISRLELETGRIVPGKTLLFFDEIQACPHAIISLRYFYEQMPDLHVIAAGSLLEFAFGEISIPVGRVQYLHIHPLNFHEYLLASGNEVLAEYYLKHPSEVDESVQKKLLDELKLYFFIGGMPEAVKVWTNTGSLIEVGAVQGEILDSYRDDFSKYRPQVDLSCLDSVFLNSAKSAGEQLKYVKLGPGHSGQQNKKAFELLEKAKIVKRIPSADPSGLPLGASANMRKFKASFIDIGLLQKLCGLSIDSELKQSDLLAIYRGKLAEQFTAQEILSVTDSELYYWAREAKSSSAEVDYIVVKDGEIYPVEVKSGAAGRLKSLHLYLQTYRSSPFGIVLYDGVYKELSEQKLVFMP